MATVIDASVRYWTHFGQQIGIVGAHASLGAGDPHRAPLFSYEPDALWRGRVTIPAPCGVLRYRYFLRHDGGATELEWGPERELDLAAPGAPAHVELRETWRAPGPLGGFFHSSMLQFAFGRTAAPVAGPAAAAASSSALLEAALSQPRHDRTARSPHLRIVRVRVQLHEPRVDALHSVALCGSARELGGWDPALAPRLLGRSFPLWTLDLELPEECFPVEYKFVVVAHPAAGAAAGEPPPAGDPAGGLRQAPYGWEDGENRRLELPEFTPFGALTSREREHLARELLAGGGGWGAAGTGASSIMPAAAAGAPARAAALAAQELLQHAEVLRGFSSDTWVRRPRLPAPPSEPAAPPPLAPCPLPVLGERRVVAVAIPTLPQTTLLAEEATAAAAPPTTSPPLPPLAAVADSSVKGAPDSSVDDVAGHLASALAAVAAHRQRTAADADRHLPLDSPGSATACVDPASRDSEKSNRTGGGEGAPRAASVPPAPLSPHASLDVVDRVPCVFARPGAISTACHGESRNSTEFSPSQRPPECDTPLGGASQGRPSASHCRHDASSPSPSPHPGGGDAPPTDSDTASAAASPASAATLVVAHSFMIRMDARPWRASSLCVPLFALRSERGLGVGELADLPPLVDWARSVGLRRVHLLPINDTCATGSADDASPHRIISSCALHPLYLNLDCFVRPQLYPPGYSCLGATSAPADGGAGGSVPIADRIPASLAARIDAARAQLNGGVAQQQAREPLDYEAVMRVKLAIVRELYRAVGELVLASPGFARWFRGNRDWLQPYALFCFFRDLQGTADTSQWGSRRAVTQAQLQSLADASQLHYKSVALWYFVQYLLHLQLESASAHAQRVGVLLQVDVPFGMPRASADVWAHPELFKLARAAGTPPDAGAPTGTRSSVVPYDWDAPAASGDSGDAPLTPAPLLAWWARRLQVLGAYVPAVQLAGVEEFFRGYELPDSAVSGLGGVFHPSSPGFTAAELAAAGVPPDVLPRLTAPYVREWTARAALGPGFAELVPAFFDIAPHSGAYSFKAGLDSEAALRDACSAASAPPLALGGLIQLLQNVCLLTTRDAVVGAPPPPPPPPHTWPPTGTLAAAAATAATWTVRFHPRTDMQKTTSFLELPEATRRALIGLHGLYFTQRAPDVWRVTGRARLEALQRLAPGILLTCDDPLPRAGITPVLHALGIPGLRSHRLSAQQLGGDPAPLGEYGCTAMPSTPDMAPLRSWWEEDASVSARYYYSVLGGQGAAPRQCTPAVAQGVLRQYARARCQWVELLLQDVLALLDNGGSGDGGGAPSGGGSAAGAATAAAASDGGGSAHGERINVPANPRHVWRWRSGVSLEELAGGLGGGLRRELGRLLAEAGRAGAPAGC